MQEFGMKPPEKAMAGTLLNITKGIPPKSMKSEFEDIELTPSSLAASAKDHQREDKGPNDKHTSEEIKDPYHHEYEDVDAHTEPKLDQESSSSVSSALLSVPSVAMETEAADIQQEEHHEREIEENTSEEVDLEVTAVDEDEVEKHSLVLQDKETEKEMLSKKGPILQGDAPHADTVRSEMEVESRAPPPAVELEEDKAPTPPSSPPPPSTTNLDDFVPQQDMKVYDKGMAFSSSFPSWLFLQIFLDILHVYVFHSLLLYPSSS